MCDGHRDIVNLNPGVTTSGRDGLGSSACCHEDQRSCHQYEKQDFAKGFPAEGVRPASNGMRCTIMVLGKVELSSLQFIRQPTTILLLIGSSTILPRIS